MLLALGVVVAAWAIGLGSARAVESRQATAVVSGVVGSVFTVALSTGGVASGGVFVLSSDPSSVTVAATGPSQTTVTVTQAF